MPLLETTIIHGPEDQEKSILVSYIKHKAYRGRRDSLGGKARAGAPLEPDEGAYIEIISVRDLATNERIPYDEDLWKMLEERCWNDAESE